jgi:predicted RNase H-like nuclease (RuvC/YqgF family)
LLGPLPFSEFHREPAVPDFPAEFWSILRESSQLLDEEDALMALNAVERVSDQVPGDDFEVLEEKVYRTIEMYKSARQAQTAAERDAQRFRQQVSERDEEIANLRRETVQLKKEREEIRGRVEKMLAQIESVAEAS